MQDGAVYNGEMKEITNADGTKSQIKHGNGVQTWADGANFAGEWVNGQAEGFGTFTHANGDVFEG